MSTLSFFTVSQRVASLDWTKKRIGLDLREVTFLEPFAVVYLGMVLRYYNSRGRFFDIDLPDNAKVCEYLRRHNFYKRFKLNPLKIEEEDLRRIEKSSSLNDILDITPDSDLGEEVSRRVFELLHDNRVRIETSVVSEHIAEVVDNFSNHARERLGAFLVQYFPNARSFRVAIGDTGVGIRASLSENPRFQHLQNKEASTALAKAFEPLVSRRIEGGTGLSDLRDYILSTNGYLYCSSDDGYYMIQGGRISTGRMPFCLPGVQMEFGFPEMEPSCQSSISSSPI